MDLFIVLFQKKAKCPKADNLLLFIDLYGIMEDQNILRIKILRLYKNILKYPINIVEAIHPILASIINNEHTYLYKDTLELYTVMFESEFQIPEKKSLVHTLLKLLTTTTEYTIYIYKLISIIILKYPEVLQEYIDFIIENISQNFPPYSLKVHSSVSELIISMLNSAFKNKLKSIIILLFQSLNIYDHEDTDVQLYNVLSLNSVSRYISLGGEVINMNKEDLMNLYLRNWDEAGDEIITNCNKIDWIRSSLKIFSQLNNYNTNYIEEVIIRIINSCFLE